MKTYANHATATKVAEKLISKNMSGDRLTYIVQALPDGRFCLIFFVDQDPKMGLNCSLMHWIVNAGHRTMVGFIPAMWLGNDEEAEAAARERNRAKQLRADALNSARHEAACGA